MKLSTKTKILFIIAGLLALFAYVSTRKNTPSLPTLRVGAAASLREVMEKVATQPEQQKMYFEWNFAGTPALLSQLKAGAPMDIVLAADLQDLKNAPPETAKYFTKIVPLTRNQLVVITHDPSLAQNFDLPTLLKAHPKLKVALAQADVPAGRYARRYMQALAHVNIPEDQIVISDNVRGVLLHVQKKLADIGMVYVSDLMTHPENVLEVYRVPLDQTGEILYGAASTTHCGNAATCEQFLQFLSSPGTQQVFQHFGFQPLELSP